MNIEGFKAKAEGIGTFRDKTINAWDKGAANLSPILKSNLEKIITLVNQTNPPADFKLSLTINNKEFNFQINPKFSTNDFVSKLIDIGAGENVINFITHCIIEHCRLGSNQGQGINKGLIIDITL